MDQQKKDYFKKRLEDERVLVENEMRDLGVEDPSNPGTWDATPGEIDESATEPDEVADRFEDLEVNEDELREIQGHWRNIKRALDKLDDGSFGICEVGGEEIEEERLEVNPSARTCKSHMDDEAELGE